MILIISQIILATIICGYTAILGSLFLDITLFNWRTMKKHFAEIGVEKDRLRVICVLIALCDFIVIIFMCALPFLWMQMIGV